VSQRNCQSFNFAINLKNKEIQTSGTYLEIYNPPNGAFSRLKIHSCIVASTVKWTDLQSNSSAGTQKQKATRQIADKG
jgi:hypothetical protein